jgi:pimeloyl-ACP methyl ester carboxylesterase
VLDVVQLGSAKSRECIACDCSTWRPGEWDDRWVRFFEHEGLRLAYDVIGGGLPVVLHTGAGGHSRMWRDAGYVAGLAGFQVVLLDHRGHGQSDTPVDRCRHAVDDYASDVVALADELGLARFAFWGYSDGACVGFAVAVAHPDRVTAVVASGGMGAPDEDPDEVIGAAALVRQEGIRSILGDEPAPDWLIRQLADETEHEVVARELECFAGWSAWPLLGRIEAPTLLIAGEHESEHLLDAAAALPNAGIVVLPAVGHLGAFFHSELVLPHVVRFLTSIAEALTLSSAS